MKALNLLGMKFGRLSVLSNAGKRGKHHLWNCSCDCGKTTIVQTTNLRTGNSRSCGCLKIERVTRHKMSGGNRVKSRAYVSWNCMKDRCTNPNNPEYHNYGGRGINYDPAWNDFLAFFADMGERPEGLSIHRINNDGDYCKENCVWADDKTQASNRRTDGRYPRVA